MNFTAYRDTYFVIKSVSCKRVLGAGNGKKWRHSQTVAIKTIRTTAIISISSCCKNFGVPEREGRNSGEEEKNGKYWVSRKFCRFLLFIWNTGLKVLPDGMRVDGSTRLLSIPGQGSFAGLAAIQERNLGKGEGNIFSNDAREFSSFSKQFH
jgi:hypothetical protein